MRIYGTTSTRSILISITLVSSVLTSAALGQEALRWKLTKGDQLKFNRRHERVMKGTVGDQPLAQGLERTTDVTLVVDAVDDDGTAQITQTIDRVRFSQVTPGGKIEYDSAEPPSAEGGKLADSLQPLVGLSFSFQMTPRGEVSKIELSEASKKRLADNPAAIPAGQEVELLRQLVPSFILPEEETVSPGTTWQDVSEVLEPRVGTRKVTSTYEYTGSHAADEDWFADIEIRGSAKLEPVKGASAQIEVLEEDISGTAHFDPRGGHLVEKAENDKTKTRISVAEQSFEQEIESLMVVKLIRDDKPEEASKLHPKTEKPSGE